MYNLRYHIASLVAVFLALAIGLVLGSVVAERGYLDKQRSGIIESLQTDFSELRSENDGLKTSLASERQFSADAVDSLTAGALSGRTVLVLANAGAVSGLSVTTDAVEKAGGRPIVATLSKAGLGLDDDEVAGTVKQLVPAAQAAGADLRQETVKALAAEWTTPNAARPVTAALSQAGELEMPDLEASQTVNAAALIATFDGKPDALLADLLAALKADKATVAGVETTAKSTGVVDASDAKGLSTVDHADTASGRLALVWLLAGRVEGRFGRGQGADALFPPLTSSTP